MTPAAVMSEAAMTPIAADQCSSIAVSLRCDAEASRFWRGPMDVRQASAQGLVKPRAPHEPARDRRGGLTKP